MMNEDRIARALLDPPSVFETPNGVLEDLDLSTPQKIEILRRWEYDASESCGAEDEGMAHVSGGTLDQILHALQKLVPDIDTDRSPPTKQGGLDRAALSHKPTEI